MDHQVQQLPHFGLEPQYFPALVLAHLFRLLKYRSHNDRHDSANLKNFKGLMRIRSTPCSVERFVP